MTRIIFGVVIFFTLASSNQPTSAAVVYDSLVIAGGGHGVRDGEAGQAVQLSGNAREVTRIELSLGALRSNPEFLVRFYKLDGVGGAPGTLFWESPTQVLNTEPPVMIEQFVTIDVPGVVVPDRFVWAVKGLDSEGSVMVVSSPPPTVGGNSDMWTRTSQFDWFKFHLNTGVVGARIIAIPEPGTMLQIALRRFSHSQFAFAAIKLQFARNLSRWVLQDKFRRVGPIPTSLLAIRAWRA